MKRLEPNLLLALSTALALVLVVVTASFYGATANVLRNVLLAVFCTAGFVLLNPMLQRRMKFAVRPPMIHRDSPGTAVWAGLFPLAVICAAAIPIFWPGHDYGLLIIIAAVWTGVTIESAIKALRRA
ncbi:hypothetical protein N0B44_20070 [Roseibacterium beibuensis]|uniref:hypothetical protein n=1 Tax=[Roseibacterium] beibuensis TaxID=1193142 RepID=UPI00217CF7EE|nr:hypothetical protein [Roseibacterium beibuensis]MCS6625213.1 hypothetical protein [Roseibacterium beibuensis]